MQPRDVKPAVFDAAPKPTISRKQCWRCQAKRQHLVPNFSDVPGPLRNLSDAAAAALAVLEVDVGPEIRSLQSSGYRQHSAMIRFSWQEWSVDDRIEYLSSDDDLSAAREAYNWLYENNAAFFY